MINVIKHGKETFKAVCPICGCEFTYQAEDLKEDCFHNHYVDCPDCKQAVPHVYELKKKEIIWDSVPDNKKDKWFYIETPLVSPFIDWPDCDKCPNRPDPSKPAQVGDTPCTWCKKNQPYCYTGDVFPKDYKGGEYKATCFSGPYKYTNTDGHVDVSYVTPYNKEAVNLDTNYTTDIK